MPDHLPHRIQVKTDIDGPGSIGSFKMREHDTDASASREVRATARTFNPVAQILNRWRDARAISSDTAFPGQLDCWHRRTSLLGKHQMQREIEIRTRAEKDLRRIPQRDGKRIARAIVALASNLSGDVKRLTNFTPEYRLRVGDWRVLFELEDDRIVIYRILHRREAYR